MKHLNIFINESIKKERCEEIEDQFIEWAQDLLDNAKNFEEFKELIYDDIADFADEYDLDNSELDELTHPKNDKAPSFNNWIEFIIKEWNLK